MEKGFLFDVILNFECFSTAALLNNALNVCCARERERLKGDEKVEESQNPRVSLKHIHILVMVCS